MKRYKENIINLEDKIEDIDIEMDVINHYFNTHGKSYIEKHKELVNGKIKKENDNSI